MKKIFRNHAILFSAHYIQVLIIIFFCGFWCVGGVAQDMVKIGLTGRWSNDFGSINDIRLIEQEDDIDGERFYAYCASSEGLAILNINIDRENRSFKSSVKSLIHFGDCYRIALQEIQAYGADKNIYAYLINSDVGVYIVDVTNPESPHCMATCHIPGNVLDIAVEGEFIYAATGWNGLQVIDISNKNRPKIIGNCTISISIEKVGAMGNYAYVADNKGNVYSIDISVKNSPIFVGSCAIPDSALDIVVAENYTYMVTGESGLQIVKNSESDGIEIVGSCNTSGYANDIAIENGYAYIADGDSGLQVININDPNESKAVGSCDTPGDAIAVDICRRYVCMFYLGAFDFEGGLLIIDISDKQGPVNVGSCKTQGDANGILVRDNYAYVADEKGLRIIDIDFKNNFEIVGGCNTPGITEDVAIVGDYAYITEGNIGLKVIQISTGKIVGGIGTPGYAGGVFVEGNYAYVADGESGLQVIDISIENNPTIIKSIDTPGNAEDIFIIDELAFIADGESGLRIASLNGENGPEVDYFCDTPGYAGGVFVEGNYAYVADGETGLQIIDISIENNPTIIKSLDTPGTAEAVFIMGDFAYIADGGNGLQIIDIKGENSPIIIGCCGTPGYAIDVFIDGNYAFVADKWGGLQIIDLTNMNGPRMLGNSTVLAEKEIDITVVSGYAYVVDGESLKVIDFNNKNGPNVIGSCITPGEAKGVFVDGNYAFVADGEKGLQVIDLYAMNQPEVVDFCDTPGYAEDVFIEGNYAYVADGESGLQIINLHDANGPIIFDSCDTTEDYGGYSKGIFIEDDYAYIANDVGGLQIIMLKDPNGPMIIGDGGAKGPANNVVVQDNYAYVAYGRNGLQIFSILNKRWPVIVGEYEYLSCNAEDIAVMGNYAYVTNSRKADHNGLWVINISNRKDPEMVWGYDTQGHPKGIFAAQDFVYVAERENRVLQFRIMADTSPKGNLILVAGGTGDFKNPYWDVIQSLANHVFYTFTSQGYDISDIYYLNPVSYQDIELDNITNQLVVDDPSPTKEGTNEGFMYAISNWAVNETLNMGPLYISLFGHGAEDSFQIMPGDILISQEFDDYINAFQTDTNRPVVLILEFAASGTFIDDLAPRPNELFQDITIITSTSDGPSYIKPPQDPNNAIPISFSSLLMKEMANYLLEDYDTSLRQSFIEAREQLYAYGSPFLDQAHQMYIPGGPFSLSFIPEDPNVKTDPFIINEEYKEAPFAFKIGAFYSDGNSFYMNPDHFRFLSSNKLILDPDDPNQLQIVSDQIFIQPDKNGVVTLIAYPDPDIHPNILLTVRLPIEVSITGKVEAGREKAIIVAGYLTDQGEPDNLWEATNTIANHAYLSLRKKHYSKENIIYINPLYLQDPDRNQEYDDIDAYPSLKNIDMAFDQIVNSGGAEELLIFLIDHGLPGIFNLNPKEDEHIKIEKLADKICTVAPHVQEYITVLIDACYSGSFIPSLHEQMSLNCGNSDKVILITSSSAAQKASFHPPDGLVSFSYPFFDEFFLTNSLLYAFDYAACFLAHSIQIPKIHNCLSAWERDKGLVYYIDEARPVIIESGFSRNNGTIEANAQVFSLSGIDKVWLLITSCEESSIIPQGGPHTDTPVIELFPDDPNNLYGGWYSISTADPYPDSFNYQVVLFTEDSKGKVVSERSNLGIQERNESGAIIIVTNLDIVHKEMAKAIDEQSYRTYRILKEKQLSDDDIFYIKSKKKFTDEQCVSPTLTALENDLPLWLGRKEYRSLLIYLIGENMINDDGETCLKFDASDMISPETLYNQIISHQRKSTALFFCETTEAKGFLNELFNNISQNPDLNTTNWIGIAAPYIQPQRPLFSNFFFSRICCFDTIGESFEKAYWAFEPPLIPSEYIYSYDFTPKTFHEIRQKLGYHIGNPEITGNDVNLIWKTQISTDSNSIVLRLKINDYAQIDPNNTPWVEFRTPSGNFYTNQLYQLENPYSWGGLFERDSNYTQVRFYAQQNQDSNQPGIIDWQEYAIGESLSSVGPDRYEIDNTIIQAWPIVLEIPQAHSFHDANDIDYVYFFGHEGDAYKIIAHNEFEYYIQISLYDPNDNKIKVSQNRLSWDFTKSGYYTVGIRPSIHPNEGPYNYTLSILDSQAPLPTVDVLGRIVIDKNGKKVGINGVDVFIESYKSTTGSLKNVRDSILNPESIDGWFFIENIVSSNSYSVIVKSKKNPNIILREPESIALEPNAINFLGDLFIEQVIDTDQIDPNQEAVSGFDRLYTRWQQDLGKQFFLWGDIDSDGFYNQEEFFNDSDPEKHTAKIILSPGLNLFPFDLSTSPSAHVFCFERLREWQSIWGKAINTLDKENKTWNCLFYDGDGNNFPLDQGYGYIIYKSLPEILYLDAAPQSSFNTLNPGLNLVSFLSFCDSNCDTSYKYLNEKHSKGTQSINRYSKSEKVLSEKGAWESSYMFFGRPSGYNFDMSSGEAYLISVTE